MKFNIRVTRRLAIQNAIWDLQIQHSFLIIAQAHRTFTLSDPNTGHSITHCRAQRAYIVKVEQKIIKFWEISCDWDWVVNDLPNCTISVVFTAAPECG